MVHGQLFAPARHAGGDGVGPEVERGHQEVVETAHQTTDQQQFSLIAAFRARHDDFRCGSSFRERIFAVHVRDEVFAERYQEEDAEEAAKQRRHENLEEIDLDLRACHGVSLLDNVDSRQGEDGTRHNHAGAGANGLDDHVFRQRALAFGDSGDTHGDDGNRDGRLEHLTEAQAGIGRGGGKDDRHQDAPEDGPGIEFRIFFVVQKDRLVFFAFLELPIRIFGKFDFVFELFNCSFFFFHITKFQLFIFF